ncbi:LOW QUALITY PROTEIN: P-selectin glycoprotein ligand 1 [Calypte anna]|uniref:LOW QUALITY PROTEIN: P-selectin glycoprotein ligand 1 n=1 Tax=Calypte anna TaxID=9244 RepID=UPI0011C39B67|nr:LOW QUALITY PROTEIN: P-selectin glycoprotein ligand 1 [Calypte anna]
MLMLSTLWVCRAVPEPGQHLEVLWVWGHPGRHGLSPPLLLSRRRREDGGQQPGVTTSLPISNAVSLDPDPLVGSGPAPAPSTNSSLVVTGTAHPWDETHSPDPDLQLSSAPAPTSEANPGRAPEVMTTADPWDETHSPDPDPMPPAPPSTRTRQHQALEVTTAAELQDETDSPDPLSSAPAAPSTRPKPQPPTTTTSRWITSPIKEGTAATGSSSATPQPSRPPPEPPRKPRNPELRPHRLLHPLGTGKAEGQRSDVPWDPRRVMGKCLLAMLLLALVAATFMGCTGVLGALLWQRSRRARHQLGPTEMVCISSLLPDSQVATNGPRPIPAPRHKTFLDGGTEADSDNLTLSSFLP